MHEVVDLLAARAPGPSAVIGAVGRYAFVCLDGTVTSTRASRQREYHNARLHRYGVDVQALADRRGQELWVSAALPGSVSDLNAARCHGIIAAVTSAQRILNGHRGSLHRLTNITKTVLTGEHTR